MGRGQRSETHASGLAGALRRPRPAQDAPAWVSADRDLDAIRGGDWQLAAQCLNEASSTSARAVQIAVADAVKSDWYGQAFEMCAQASGSDTDTFAGRLADRLDDEPDELWTANSLLFCAQDVALELCEEEAESLALTPRESMERTIGPEDARKVERAHGTKRFEEKYSESWRWREAANRLPHMLKDGHTGQEAWLRALSYQRPRATRA